MFITLTTEVTAQSMQLSSLTLVPPMAAAAGAISCEGILEPSWARRQAKMSWSLLAGLAPDGSPAQPPSLQPGVAAAAASIMSFLSLERYNYLGATSDVGVCVQTPALLLQRLCPLQAWVL